MLGKKSVVMLEKQQVTIKIIRDCNSNFRKLNVTCTAKNKLIGITSFLIGSWYLFSLPVKYSVAAFIETWLNHSVLLSKYLTPVRRFNQG